MVFIFGRNFFPQAGIAYDPIVSYLDKSTWDKNVIVIGERVRSKGYHDMMKWLIQRKVDPGTAKESSRIAGRYHLARWKQLVGAL